MSTITLSEVSKEQEIRIFAGEGELTSTDRIYSGERTERNLRAAFRKERSNGDRWAIACVVHKEFGFTEEIEL